mgnify:CR=1 FL=1
MREITIGETKSGEIDAFELQNQYLVDLEKGKKYEVSMRSKVGDSYFLIFPTTKLPTKIFESDDAEDDAGIFGFDAIDEFKPEESGKYAILIPSDGYASIEYKLFVKEVK